MSVTEAGEVNNETYYPSGEIGRDIQLGFTPQKPIARHQWDGWTKSLSETHVWTSGVRNIVSPLQFGFRGGDGSTVYMLNDFSIAPIVGLLTQINLSPEFSRTLCPCNLWLVFETAYLVDWNWCPIVNTLLHFCPSVTCLSPLSAFLFHALLLLLSFSLFHCLFSLTLSLSSP